MPVERALSTGSFNASAENNSTPSMAFEGRQRSLPGKTKSGMTKCSGPREVEFTAFILPFKAKHLTGKHQVPS